MIKRVERATLDIAKSSSRKEKRENLFLMLSAYASLFSVIIALLFITLTVFNISGFATFVPSQAGQITKVDLTYTRPVYMWAGIYGMALRVPGFTETNYIPIFSGTVERKDAFFDCIKLDAQGGPEIYASTYSDLDFSNVRPATIGMVNQFLGCNGVTTCAENTFKENMSVYIGNSLITNIPATHTFKYDNLREVFDLGILNVSGKLVFVSHINLSIQKGFNPNITVNYQMLLPSPENDTYTYNLFVDPEDSCPGGGIGFSINATVSGYAFDSNGNVLEDVRVTVAGYDTYTNMEGFYNLSFLVVEGNYNFLGLKENYDDYISNVTVRYDRYIIEKNFTMRPRTPYEDELDSIGVRGYVFDSITRLPISNATIYFGTSSTYTNNTGYYFINSTVLSGNNLIISIKKGYENNVSYIYFNGSQNIYDHNMTMYPVNDENFEWETGPYTKTKTGTDVGPGLIDEIREEAKKNGEDYWVSTDSVYRQVRINTFVEEKISFFNFRNGEMKLNFEISPEIADIVKIDSGTLTVPNQNGGQLILTIFGTKPLGIYQGYLNITGDLTQSLPITVEIIEKRNPFELLEMEIDLFDKYASPGKDLRYKLFLKNLLLPQQSYKVYLTHGLKDLNKSTTYANFSDEVEIEDSLSVIEFMNLPKEIKDGNYLLEVNARYLNYFSTISVPVRVAKPVYMYSFLGLPLWLYTAIFSVLSFVFFNFFLIRRRMEKKKRYHLETDYNTLPQAGPRSIKLGKIAETNIPSYYDLDMLCTHAIIAGATGGGKSISAQVLIEEALLKNIAVIVFDPTAQWSGMLRKCDDKKMMGFYPKFGLKPSDARAFPGSVRQVKDARQAINIKKFMTPGQIQIFTLNKLDPSEMDVFVASVIASIFRTGPEEYPGLRVILVFDEVHRLLPKFGGSGKGFLQIERACREFRKWGFGVMLVSQVLSDFVGEIKANINTEILMRAAEENDLQRIRERYGDDALRSLVRADVGTGMIQNAEYNRGRPFFVALRPILHNTRRLTDDILDRYNSYNDIIDDIEYQIEQLEEFKIDVFDLKMELKLVRDKLMTGNFSVVDIYLEGLKPRLEKQWQKIGKKPKKKEIELVDLSTLESSIKEAQKGRTDWKGNGAKPETTEAKKEEGINIETKIVKSITFDNGLMVSSLKEMKETLPGIDDDVFKIHVSEEKNDIAEWIEKNIDTNLGKNLRKIKDKQEMLNALNAFGKEEKKTDSKKTEEKKPEEKK